MRKRINKNIFTGKMNIIVTILIIKKTHTSSPQYTNRHADTSKELDITPNTKPNSGIQKYDKSSFVVYKKYNSFHDKDNVDRLKESISKLRNFDNNTKDNSMQNELHHMQRDQNSMNLHSKKAKIT
ncbi:hypothetical protein COBT_003228, partial [Conglomerata obtusa]